MAEAQRARHRASSDRRRTRRLPLALFLLALVAGVVVVVLAAPSILGRGPSHAAEVQLPAVGSSGIEPVVPAPGGDGAADQGWPVFATAAGLSLQLPNPGTEAVAYHQASYPDAMPLIPAGTLLKNYAGKLLDRRPDTEGPRYIVQPQRAGRGTEPTSAVDLVLPKRMDVFSPVSGKVVVAKRYKLYGQYPDMRIEIRPTEHPELRVVIIHLTDVAVHKGDEVVVNETALGTARVFPFHSVVNDYVGGGDPHVHLEVKKEESL